MAKQYQYPMQYDQHMIDVPFLKDVPNLTGDYPFRNLSFKGRVGRFLTYLACFLIGFPMISLLLGAKVVGRKNFKKYRQELKNGAITICNHVHMWDKICVLKAIRYKTTYHPAWPTNLRGPNAIFIRGIGGLPVPKSLSGLKRFSDTMDEIMNEGKWMHFFPEGSMWFYYPSIRPFKKGAFTLAVKHDKPIIPIAINYRKAKGIRKIFRKGNPYFLTINIGEPVFINHQLDKSAAVEDLLTRSRQAMIDLSGFTDLIDQNQTSRKE